MAPQHHASVPRYWSKLASRIIVGIENSSAAKRAAYRSRCESDRPTAIDAGRAAGRRARALYASRALAVFDRMLKKLGLHRVRIALSAGAPLPAEVQALWQVWGVNLQEPLRPDRSRRRDRAVRRLPRPGSVGRPYPGAEVRLGPDDEIIARSPGCFAGYWARRGGVGRGAAARRHPHRRRRHVRRRRRPADRRSQEGHRDHGGRQECQPEPNRDRAEIKSLHQRSERHRRRAQVSHRADRARHRHRVGVGARQQRSLYELPFARDQSRRSTG